MIASHENAWAMIVSMVQEIWRVDEEWQKLKTKRELEDTQVTQTVESIVEGQPTPNDWKLCIRTHLFNL